jgi:hypothetical protein
MRPGELEAELEYIEQKCADHGIARPVSFAYPAYVSTPAAINVLSARGYTLARAGGSRPFDLGSDNPYLVPSYSTTGSTEAAAERVIAALAGAGKGKAVVLTVHGVPDTAHPQVTTSPELFQRYLEFLRDHDYKVVALRDLAGYLPRAGKAPFSAAPATR